MNNNLLYILLSIFTLSSCAYKPIHIGSGLIDDKVRISSGNNETIYSGNLYSDVVIGDALILSPTKIKSFQSKYITITINEHTKIVLPTETLLNRKRTPVLEFRFNRDRTEVIFFHLKYLD